MKPLDTHTTSVEISDNDKVITSVDSIDGTWTCQLTLAKGNHELRAKVDETSLPYSISQTSNIDVVQDFKNYALGTYGFRFITDHIDFSTAKGHEFLISEQGEHTRILGITLSATLKMSEPLRAITLSFLYQNDGTWRCHYGNGQIEDKVIKRLADWQTVTFTQGNITSIDFLSGAYGSLWIDQCLLTLEVGAG
ncbi:hypothetical protein [Pseudomonas graminis]|uniref:Uncharacterized protein n=1 Tax=Pseudomonas graminis TaxID=158627 RepID=A0A1I0FVA7_9PSED|nr:hypothetical protein [Pseudomonas graminis]SET62456.1 hypothetical protein SAMN05216197_11860 [Pseudomonas graminis]